MTLITGCDLIPSVNQETVELEGDAFVPQEIEIQPGTTVKWINRDMHPHTVTSGIRGSEDAGELFDMELETTGQDFSYIFQTAGTYSYFCRIHPDMDGTITVIDIENTF